MQTEQFELNAELELKHWWFVGRRRVLRTLIEEIVPPGRERVVVDVGCGTGGNIASLAEAYHAVGIDPAEAAVAWARERFPQVTFHCGFAPAAGHDDLVRADLVMLNDVLEHVPDDFLLLSQLLEVIPVGCHVLITVPADPTLWSPHDVSHAHYRRYEVARLARVWRDQPVDTLLLSPFNSRLYPIVRGVRALNKRLGRASGKADTDLKLPPHLANCLLESSFAGERHRLLRLLRSRAKGNGDGGYRKGVSLVAILRRRAGEVKIGPRPGDVAADVHGPEIDR